MIKSMVLFTQVCVTPFHQRCRPIACSGRKRT